MQIYNFHKKSAKVGLNAKCQLRTGTCGLLHATSMGRMPMLRAHCGSASDLTAGVEIATAIGIFAST